MGANDEPHYPPRKAKREPPAVAARADLPAGTVQLQQAANIRFKQAVAADNDRQRQIKECRARSTGAQHQMTYSH